VFKWRRLRRAGHVAGMGQLRMLTKFLAPRHSTWLADRQLMCCIVFLLRDSADQRALRPSLFRVSESHLQTVVGRLAVSVRLRTKDNRNRKADMHACPELSLCACVHIEPTIPVFDRQMIVHALDRAAAVIGCLYYALFKKESVKLFESRKRCGPNREHVNIPSAYVCEACYIVWLFHCIRNASGMYYLLYEFLTAVVMTNPIFWDITQCSPLKVNRCFGGTCRLHLQGRRISR
jgi:hypothetical protein